MMTSSNGNIFRVTGHLCGEFTGLRWFPVQRPVTRSFDVFFDLRLNKRLSKQSWGWWFEMLSRPLLRHHNASHILSSWADHSQSGCCCASAFRPRRHYVFGLSIRPSVRPKPEISSFDLYMGPLVHWTNRNRFTACPSVRPSVQRGFQAFAGECMEGLAWNFTCWCILTIFRTDKFMAMVCWFF